MNHWNKVAVEFDRLYQQDSRVRFAVNRLLRRGLFERTEETCKVIREFPSPTVLDVGCGSGRNIVDYYRSGASHVTGIDSASRMLELARDLLASTGVLEKTELLLADFVTARFDRHYDFVVALGVFDYLHDELPDFLTKMGQLATRGVVWSAPARSLVRMPFRWLRYRRHGIRVHFYGRREVEALCQAAGFRRFAVKRLHSSGFLVIGWS